MINQILVVDDDPLMHMLFKNHLERAGYQMLSATNGGEVLEIAAREQPGLIVLDVMMPDKDGLAILRELKKAEATKTIPVIVMTANGHFMMRKESENSGAAMLLTKPFSPTHLLNEIRRLAPMKNQ